MKLLLYGLTFFCIFGLSVCGKCPEKIGKQGMNWSAGHRGSDGFNSMGRLHDEVICGLCNVIIPEYKATRRTLVFRLLILTGIGRAAADSYLVKRTCPPQTSFHVSKNCVMVVNDWEKFGRKKWYEYASFGDVIKRITARCLEDEFPVDNLTQIYNHRNYVLRWIPIKFSSKREVESLTFCSFLLKGEGMFSSTTQMTLLDTDYENYAILWSCEEGLFSAKESSWIYTRKRLPNFSDDIEKQFQDSLKSVGLDWNQYGYTAQDDQCDDKKKLNSPDN